MVTISKSDYPNGKFAFLGDDVIKMNNTATVVPKTFSIRRTGGLLGQQTVSLVLSVYSKPCVKWPPSKRPKIGLLDQLSLNAGQKYCRMLQGDHSPILSTFIKLPVVIKIYILSIFEWPFYTGLTIEIFLGLESGHKNNISEKVHVLITSHIQAPRL